MVKGLTSLRVGLTISVGLALGCVSERFARVIKRSKFVASIAIDGYLAINTKGRLIE